MYEGTDAQHERYDTSANAWMFFRRFLRHPSTVASVLPSSRYLTRRLADVARMGHLRTVVELGPGTGCTTRALLRVMGRDARLLAIDLDETFVENLRGERDDRLIVHHGSAERLNEIVQVHGMPSPDLVVSGIPFSTMPAECGRRIAQQVWAALAPGGRFLAYQLRGHVARFAAEWMGRPEVRMEVRNVPPMRIYCWSKPAASA
ncbi:MAG: methyltransferase domain-containing protein [Burkholderiales bacterium]|nr:methyltransferase domain-containing protein [Burkholderiales bacterium]